MDVQQLSLCCLWYTIALCLGENKKEKKEPTKQTPVMAKKLTHTQNVVVYGL